MDKLLWRLIALYWFWRLARYPSWEATGELWESFMFDRDDPEEAVRDELAAWADLYGKEAS